MTDATPEIIEKARAALIAHGLAENDGDDYVLDGVYATGAIAVILEAVADDLRAAKAEAWDEGFGAGHEAARADLFGGHWCMDHNHPEEAA